MRKHSFKAYEYTNKTWRGITSSREWTSYRLSVFKANLAVTAVLREFRLLAEVSAAAVAKEIGVAACTLCNWETGRSVPNEVRQEQYRRAVAKLAKVVARQAA